MTHRYPGGYCWGAESGDPPHLTEPGDRDPTGVFVADPRLSRLAQKRAHYMRSGPFDMLVEGSGTSYGWVSNQLGPVRWGDYPTAEQPAWYLGRADGAGTHPIGPNGPWVGQESILPAVTRCTSILVGPLVSTRWTFTNNRGDYLERPLWVDDPMGKGTLPGVMQSTVPAGLRLDGGAFFATWLSHAIWWGLGAFIYRENATGEPTAGTLRLINPYLVGVDDIGHYVIDPNGDTPIRTDFDGKFSIGDGGKWRIAVLRGLPPQDFRTPEGVLSRHYDTLRLGASVSTYVANTFQGMGVPAGVLRVGTPGFKKDDADALKAQWMAAHGVNKRSVAVLNSTVEFQPISMTPVDAGADAMVRVARSDIAHAFGLSSVWLDEGTSGLTYQNNSDRRRDLIDISLAHWAESMMATLSTLMPYGSRVAVNWVAFTQPSFDHLITPLVQLVQAGVLTATEARQYIGREPLGGPDPAFTDNSPATKEPQPVPPALAQFAGTQPVGQEATDAPAQ